MKGMKRNVKKNYFRGLKLKVAISCDLPDENES